MINLYTEVKPEESGFKINHKSHIMLIGSCFTDEIGERFAIHGFNIGKNPFGILYNPASIAICLNRITDKEYFDKKDLIKSGEYFYAFSCHGDYRGETEEQCLEKINRSIDENHEFLKTTDTIIITLGSAWTYRYKPADYLMGNCHKIDSKLIERRMLTVEQTVQCMMQATENVKQKINSDMRFIFTLSPVRHWREGWHDNAVSKAVLYLAVDKMIKEFCGNAAYFPSYDIVTDELRDYRFYERDLLHVNQLAVDCIWEKFSDTYFSEKTKYVNGEYRKLWLMKNHRPLNPSSEAYGKHKQKTAETEAKIQSLQDW
ncbi:MAG: GSCFA domain-containing protein [Bacteroidales bacterium]|nr:GSCFA domain-containing protein [Bacteroidales bacterium]